MRRPPFKPPVNLRRRLAWRKYRRWSFWLLLGIIAIILSSLLWNLTVKLPANTTKPVDGVLVLGGSIRREISVAKVAKQNPTLKILISRGSDDPCIFYLFERANAPMNNVWLEKCALSTFDNFFFSVPILQQWDVHHVLVITSPSHLPRAKWLARIHLNAQGIAVKVKTVKEVGRPGNNESLWKTRLDVTRSVMWALAAQIIRPPCFDVIPLSQIDWQLWEANGFHCEHQSRIKGRKKKR